MQLTFTISFLSATAASSATTSLATALASPSAASTFLTTPSYAASVVSIPDAPRLLSPPPPAPLDGDTTAKQDAGGEPFLYSVRNIVIVGGGGAVALLAFLICIIYIACTRKRRRTPQQMSARAVQALPELTSSQIICRRADEQTSSASVQLSEFPVGGTPVSSALSFSRAPAVVLEDDNSNGPQLGRGPAVTVGHLSLERRSTSLERRRQRLASRQQRRSIGAPDALPEVVLGDDKWESDGGHARI